MDPYYLELNLIQILKQENSFYITRISLLLEENWFNCKNEISCLYFKKHLRHNVSSEPHFSVKSLQESSNCTKDSRHWKILIRYKISQETSGYSDNCSLPPLCIPRSENLNKTQSSNQELQAISLAVEPPENLQTLKNSWVSRQVLLSFWQVTFPKT